MKFTNFVIFAFHIIANSIVIQYAVLYIPELLAFFCCFVVFLFLVFLYFKLVTVRLWLNF